MNNDTLPSQSMNAAHCAFMVDLELRSSKEIAALRDRLQQSEMRADQRMHELEMRTDKRTHELEMQLLRRPAPEKWYSSLSAACITYWIAYAVIWVEILLIAAEHSRR